MAAKEEVEAINKHMAEKVMGWTSHLRCTDIYVERGNENKLIELAIAKGSVSRWNPSTDLNHAEKALVQWLEDNKGWVVIDSHRKYLEIGCHAMWEIDISAKVDLPSIESLSAAITEALCRATGYKEVSG